MLLFWVEVLVRLCVGRVATKDAFEVGVGGAFSFLEPVVRLNLASDGAPQRTVEHSVV